MFLLSFKLMPRLKQILSKKTLRLYAHTNTESLVFPLSSLPNC